MNRYFQPIQLILFILFPLATIAQDRPFEVEIRAFEQFDKVSPPPKNGIVFTGSSSIRLWENLSGYFPNKPLIQRGFGGSELSDVRYFADRIILRYRPKQIVLYAGENDIATGKLTAKQTFDQFVNLFQYLRQKQPGVPLVYISIKLSPSRRQFWPIVEAANKLISNYLAKQPNTRFVDIRPVMRGSDGQPIGELFKSDSLHMTEAGYRRWAPVLRPYLL